MPYLRETSPVPSGRRAIVQHSESAQPLVADLADVEVVRPLR
jgi:hypothetical protein